MAPPTVVLSAEHRSYREGLAEALASHAGLTLVAVCADAERALQEIVSRRPAVCLADLALQPWGGLQLCRRARRAVPGADTHFVLMSSDAGASLDREARSAGAALIVHKDLPRARLCELLVEVANAPPA